MSWLDTLVGAFGITSMGASPPVTKVTSIPHLADAIKAVAPSSKVHPQDWADALEPFMVSSGITTSRRVAAFVGQVSRESEGFSVLTEDLTYTAERLMQVWPTRFPTLERARFYAGNPQLLANDVYANRLGNGDETSGDGWKYRGAGLIQLTGKANQTEFAVDCHIQGDIGDFLRTMRGAAESACWFWSKNGLNTLADAWSITQITGRVNGGIADATNRVNLSNAAMRVFA